MLLPGGGLNATISFFTGNSPFNQLGLIDHLGIDRFMVMGFCIGGPFIWSLLKRAPNRIAAAVLAQPVGWRPEMRNPNYPARDSIAATGR
jgi:pimeloyl-ACP methyl ester carboxylesterase